MLISMFRDSLPIHRFAWVAVLCLGVTGCGSSSSSPGGGAGEDGAAARDTDAVESESGAEVDQPETEPAFVTAEAMLAVSGGAMFDVADTGSNHTHRSRDLTPRILTEVNQLVSEPLLDRLLRDEGVRATRWFVEHDGNSDTDWGKVLASTLSAEHVADTTLIRVTATTAAAEDSLTLVRAWIDLYLREVATRAESRYNQDRIAFQRQLESVHSEIERVEARIRRHLLDHPQSSTGQRLDAATQELLFLNAKKDEIVELLSAAQAAHNRMTAANAPPYEPTEDEVTLINSSAGIQQLDAQLRELAVLRDVELEAGRDETDPVIQNITAQIRHIEAEREQEFDHQVRSLFNARVEIAGQAVAIYRQQIETFEPRMDELRARLDDLQLALLDYEMLLRDQEHLEQQREAARGQLSELDILIRRAGAYTVELASPPAIVEP